MPDQITLNEEEEAALEAAWAKLTIGKASDKTAREGKTDEGSAPPENSPPRPTS